MARKNYRIDEVLRSLGTKKDLRIKGMTIFILTDTIVTKEWNVIRNPEKVYDLGNKSWGKIDFLTHYNDYRINYVSEFPKEKR